MWKITWDHTESPPERRVIESSDFDAEVFAKTPVHSFKIYDDDGELYLFGYSTDDSDFAPLDDFGMPSYGATEIRYQNKKTGAYETL